jgi:hypothetical protein
LHLLLYILSSPFGFWFAIYEDFYMFCQYVTVDTSAQTIKMTPQAGLEATAGACRRLCHLVRHDAIDFNWGFLLLSEQKMEKGAFM